MLHQNRKWKVVEVSSAEELADKLVNYSWTLCTGFQFGASIWLNDSTSEDGAQEYAVVRASDGQQVESITVSWCDLPRMTRYVEDFGKDPEALCEGRDWRQNVDDHPSCRLCA